MQLLNGSFYNLKIGYSETTGTIFYLVHESEKFGWQEKKRKKRDKKHPVHCTSGSSSCVSLGAQRINLLIRSDTATYGAPDGT